MTFANSILPSIKVTIDYNFDKRSVNYLDKTIFINRDGFIRTDFERKLENVIFNAFTCPYRACDYEHSVFYCLPDLVVYAGVMNCLRSD